MVPLSISTFIIEEKFETVYLSSSGNRKIRSPERTRVENDITIFMVDTIYIKRRHDDVLSRPIDKYLCSTLFFPSFYVLFRDFLDHCVHQLPKARFCQAQEQRWKKKDSSVEVVSAIIMKLQNHF